MDFASQLAGLPVASPLSFELNARRCLRLDLSENNLALHGFDPGDTPGFSAWIARQILESAADYAAGGYAEDRALYKMSKVFTTDAEEPRTLHLGIDLWLAAGTEVRAVLPGIVHSTADNAAFGDYGPTVILEHAIGNERFFTLYGHLARPTLQRTRAGQRLAAGEQIGWLGEAHENMGWPPHLHFQIIKDLDGRRGDYPGVCKSSERAQWLAGCPNPNLLLHIQALDPV